MSSRTQFEDEALRPATSLVREFCAFLADNKKWWLLPILVTFLILGLLILISSTGLAPFIYTLF